MTTKQAKSNIETQRQTWIIFPFLSQKHTDEKTAQRYSESTYKCIILEAYTNVVSEKYLWRKYTATENTVHHNLVIYQPFAYRRSQVQYLKSTIQSISGSEAGESHCTRDWEADDLSEYYGLTHCKAVLCVHKNNFNYKKILCILDSTTDSKIQLDTHTHTPVIIYLNENETMQHNYFNSKGHAHPFYGGLSRN